MSHVAITVASMSEMPIHLQKWQVRCCLRRGPPDGSRLADRPACRPARRIPQARVAHTSWPHWVHPALLATLLGEGLAAPWSHQREAMDLARSGHHVVLSTGTASGKSLGYLVPGLSAVPEGLDAPTGRGRPSSTCPRPRRWPLTSAPGWSPGPSPACVSRPTTVTPRPRNVGGSATTPTSSSPTGLTAPLGVAGARALAGLLPRPDDGRRRRMPYVSRGVFGSHVAAVLRRLPDRRAVWRAPDLRARLGDRLRSRGARLPIDRYAGGPGHRRRFTARPGHLCPLGTGHARGPTPVGDHRGCRPALAALVARDTQVVAFARSRAGVEALASRAEASRRPGAPPGGERRGHTEGGIFPRSAGPERDLRTGALIACATNASSWASTSAASMPFHRRLAGSTRKPVAAGRPRRPFGATCTAAVVAADDPLDSFLLGHPEAIFGAPVEATVPRSVESPCPRTPSRRRRRRATTDPAGPEMFGPTARACVDSLVAGGILRRRPDGWYWARDDRPADHLSLRGTDAVVAIAERHRTHPGHHRCVRGPHPGPHRGRARASGTHPCGDGVGPRDSDRHRDARRPGWTICPVAQRLQLPGSRTQRLPRCLGVHFGTVRVTTQVTGFLRRLPGGEVIGQHDLDLPERSLRTRGSGGPDPGGAGGSGASTRRLSPARCTPPSTPPSVCSHWSPRRTVGTSVARPPIAIRTPG